MNVVIETFLLARFLADKARLARLTRVYLYIKFYTYLFLSSQTMLLTIVVVFYFYAPLRPPRNLPSIIR